MFKVFQIETIILGVWTDLPKLPKIPNLLFLQHFNKKLSDAVDFLQADRHESLQKTDAKIF